MISVVQQPHVIFILCFNIHHFLPCQQGQISILNPGPINKQTYWASTTTPVSKFLALNNHSILPTN
jgi:hypothetical protein